MSELKNIPDGWMETTLGQVGKVITGKTPSKDNPEDWGNLVDFITPTEIKSENKFIFNCPRKLSAKGLERFSKMILPEKSVIVTCIGSDMGKVVLNKDKALANQQINSIVVNEKNYSDFIYYLLKDSYKILRKKAEGSGSTMPILNKSTFENLEFYIPQNIYEQKSIAEILSAFDNKIELLQAQNKTLEATAQTIFAEWFGKETEIWEYVKIIDVAEITSSKRIFYEEYVIEGIPFYRSKEIIELSTKPDISTELFISEMRYNEIKEKFDIPKKGDILLTAVGTLGIPFQVRNNREFYFKDGNLIWFKNFNKSITSDFVYNWLKLKSTQDLLNMISIGSTQKALTISSVKELKIPFIKNPELRGIFNKLLKSNLDKVNHNQEQIQTLTKTRDELLPRLMSGEIRVNEFKV